MHTFIIIIPPNKIRSNSPNLFILIMITEDFTFPIVTISKTPTVLPPLWRISSLNYQSDTESEPERKRIFRKSYSEIEGKRTLTENNRDETAKAEERMDLLWEDFNEELSVSSSTDSDFESVEHDNDGNHVGELGKISGDCIAGVRLGKNTSRLVVSGKKKNVELVLKMLKKLFLIQDIARVKHRGVD